MIIHTYNLIDSYICNINISYHFVMYIHIYMHLLSTYAYLNLVLVIENKQHVHTHIIYIKYIYWLVVWIIFIFPYIGNNPSHLTNIFQRG